LSFVVVRFRKGWINGSFMRTLAPNLLYHPWPLAPLSKPGRILYAFGQNGLALVGGDHPGCIALRHEFAVIEPQSAVAEFGDYGRVGRHKQQSLFRTPEFVDAFETLPLKGVAAGRESCRKNSFGHRIGGVISSPMGITKDRSEVLQGTLDLMVLKTLEALGPLHGYGVARRLEQLSEETLRLNEGTVYASLLRLAQKGWIHSEWGASDNNRKAKYYSISRAGRKQLTRETENWERISGLIGRVLRLTSQG
jgi:PadR family transcriptional regulator, regulatory protein PadR